MAVTVNVAAPDVPPPGGGKKTVTCDVPAVATSAAVIEARSCVALTNVVARSVPFHRTTAADVNPVPFTVNVNAALPATVDAGDSDVTVGTPGTTLTVGLVTECT